MTCSDVERILPDIMEGAEDAEFQAHLKVCPACAELFEDLRLIASEALQLAESESEDPPARVWVNIANQLRAEGIIREPETVPARPVLVPTPPRRWNAWWLAPIAAAIVAAGAYQLTHRAPTPVAQQSPQQPVAQATQPTQPAPEAQTSSPSVNQSQTLQAAREPAAQPELPSAENSTEKAELSPPQSPEDEQFLTTVSEGAPTMRATYQNQLQAVNAEIRETQAYIRLHPGDLDARQHLWEVLQQKTMLYQMALDHVQ